MTRKQELGVCYYPEHWKRSQWESDASLMREAGISLVRIGEFAWSKLEPDPGRYEFGWLQDAVDVLHHHGLKVVLGTPTATPPKWLVDQMPDMLAVDVEGRPRKFGSRRHYCFSHKPYQDECDRIVGELARRFGDHPGIAAWQTDNEYGCHDTVESYSVAALQSFRNWLREKYKNISRLNNAWGNVFWSMEYRSFDEVDEKAVLRLTSSKLVGSINSASSEEEATKFYETNKLEITKRNLIGKLFEEARVNNFTIILEHAEIAK